jgi:hypothetical protein
VLTLPVSQFDHEVCLLGELAGPAPTLSGTSDCKRQLSKRHILADSGTDLMS